MLSVFLCCLALASKDPGWPSLRFSDESPSLPSESMKCTSNEQLYEMSLLLFIMNVLRSQQCFIMDGLFRRFDIIIWRKSRKGLKE